MQRIPSIDPTTSTAASATFNQIQQALGTVPGIFKITANSPAVLNSMWAGFGAAGGGKLSKVTVEKISVAVSNSNGCEYCLSAHTFLGIKAGASAEDMAKAQKGKGKDAKETAAIQFALLLLKDRGFVSDADFSHVREYYPNEEIVEIIHSCTLTIFTNVINNTLKTPNDFPAIKLNT